MGRRNPRARSDLYSTPLEEERGGLVRSKGTEKQLHVSCNLPHGGQAGRSTALATAGFNRLPPPPIGGEVDGMTCRKREGKAASWHRSERDRERETGRRRDATSQQAAAKLNERGRRKKKRSRFLAGEPMATTNWIAWRRYYSHVHTSAPEYIHAAGIEPQ